MSGNPIRSITSVTQVVGGREFDGNSLQTLQALGRARLGHDGQSVELLGPNGELLCTAKLFGGALRFIQTGFTRQGAAAAAARAKVARGRLSPTEAARSLGIAETLVRYYMRSGLLPFAREGRFAFIEPADLAALPARRAGDATGEG